MIRENTISFLCRWMKKTLLVGLIISAVFIGCGSSPRTTILEDVIKDGEITLITQNTLPCYYIYREEAMGFEYDLAQAFAKELGVRLKIRIADNWQEMLRELQNTKAAFIAAGVSISEQKKTQAAFSDPYMQIRPSLVVHRDKQRIHMDFDLDGQTVHAPQETNYQNALDILKQRGIQFNIKLHADATSEALIRMVAGGKIDIALVDSHSARLNRRYYPKAVIADVLNVKGHLGWAVLPEAKGLLSRINAFLSKLKENGEYERIYQRYYSNMETFDYADIRAFHKRIKTRMPSYAAEIKTAAEKYGFDWRLIAAQIYQESVFIPTAISHAGAYGLMQLTRTTAKSLGVKDIFNPQENIGAGVRHLNNLYNFYNNAVGLDRLYIALAAYNIGQGHMWDARNLARSMDLDPDRIASMEKILPLLQEKKYYKNAKYGYCRGSEALNYVKQIMIYYDILKQQAIG